MKNKKISGRYEVVVDEKETEVLEEEKTVEEDVLEVSEEVNEEVASEPEVEEKARQYPAEIADMLAQVEEKKNAFYNLYKKYKKFSSLYMIILVVLMIPLFIWVMPIKTYGTWISIGAIILIFGVFYVFTNKTKTNTNESAKNYIDEYYQITMGYVFNNMPEVKNYEQLTGGKLETDVFVNAHMIKDVTSSASRNVATYDIDGREIAIAEFVAYTQGEGKRKRINPVFIGKLLKVENSIKDEDLRTLVYLKPRIKDQIAQGVNDIEGLETLFNDKDIAIYSSEKTMNKAISKEIVPLLNEYKIDKDLIDIAISITPGMTYFAFSFSDDLMAVPLESDIKVDPIILFKETMETTNKIIAKIK